MHYGPQIVLRADIKGRRVRHSQHDVTQDASEGHRDSIPLHAGSSEQVSHRTPVFHHDLIVV
jgi:hypothetical protein